MALTNLFVHDVTILHPESGVDANGFTRKAFDDLTGEDVKGWITQAGSSEARGDREAQTSTWTLVLPSDVPIAATDRVVWQGVTFEVDGAPNLARTPRGAHHTEVPLRVVDG